MGIATLRLNDYELGPDEVAAAPAPQQTARSRSRGRFLRGPVPWEWIVQAARLRGSALSVGLMLWHKVGIARGQKVLFCLSQAAEMGLGKQAARRGLRALQAAGLVSVERKPGRGLEVTLPDD
jgi:hypothetical protein